MYLIVCLGNPETKYKNNRHNIGFRVADFLVKQFVFSTKKKKFKACFYEGLIADKKVLLIKPQTYMNNSGEAVILAASFYKIPMDQILVIYDDVDLLFKNMRLKPKGSAGTHNGLKSVIACLKTTDFARLRLGIGPKPEHGGLHDFVLGDFTEEEKKELPAIIKKAGNAVESYVMNGIDSAMNNHNQGDLNLHDSCLKV